MTVTIKPTRWKHESGYRRIQVKTNTIDENCSDVIRLILPDGTEIKMDSLNGEIRLFSDYYDLRVDELVYSDACIRLHRKGTQQ